LFLSPYPAPFPNLRHATFRFTQGDVDGALFFEIIPRILFCVGPLIEEIRFTVHYQSSGLPGEELLVRIANVMRPDNFPELRVLKFSIDGWKAESRVECVDSLKRALTDWDTKGILTFDGNYLRDV
jgi:hypothetical protein